MNEIESFCKNSQVQKNSKQFNYFLMIGSTTTIHTHPTALKTYSVILILLESTKTQNKNISKKIHPLSKIFSIIEEANLMITQNPASLITDTSRHSLIIYAKICCVT